MKDATPEKDKAVFAILKLLEKMDHKYLFPDIHNIGNAKSDKEVLAEYLQLKNKVVNLYENVLFDELGLAKIQNEIFLKREDLKSFERPLLLTVIEELKKVLNKKLSKKEKKQTLIQGLTPPVKWEDITLIFNGGTIKVKQNSTSLGEYSMGDFGIPKLTKKAGRSVPQLFLCLFFSKEKKESHILLSTNKIDDVLLSTDNTNQKHKGKLSQILKNAFSTAVEPIYIDEKSNLYTPLFKVIFGGELRVNDHLSGGSLYERTEPIRPDYD